MLVINLKKCKDVRWKDRLMASFYNPHTNEITILTDHPLVKRWLPRILAHELFHFYHMAVIPTFIKKRWYLHDLYYGLIEEPLAFWTSGRKYLRH